MGQTSASREGSCEPEIRQASPSSLLAHTLKCIQSLILMILQACGLYRYHLLKSSVRNFLNLRCRRRSSAYCLSKKRSWSKDNVQEYWTSTPGGSIMIESCWSEIWITSHALILRFKYALVGCDVFWTLQIARDLHLKDGLLTQYSREVSGCIHCLGTAWELAGGSHFDRSPTRPCAKVSNLARSPASR